MHIFLPTNLKREKKRQSSSYFLIFLIAKKKKKKKKQREKNLDIMYKHKRRVTLENDKMLPSNKLHISDSDHLLIPR